jgi:hypothetical protein
MDDFLLDFSGIQFALGADSLHVRNTIVRQGMSVALVGVAIRSCSWRSRCS